MTYKGFDNVLRFQKRGGGDSIEGAESTALLNECRDRLSRGMVAAFAESMEAAKSSLFDMADRTAGLHNQSLFLAAHKVLNTRGRELLEQFHGGFIRWFDEAVALYGRAPQTSSTDESTGLSLVADEDFERELAIGKLSARASYHCSEQLTTLNRRIAVLLCAASLELENNPLHPRAIFTALLGATEAFSIDGQIALTILQELDRQAASALPALYGDLNRHLIDRGILPQLPLVVDERNAVGTSAGTIQQSFSPATPPTPAHKVGPTRDIFGELVKRLVEIGSTDAKTRAVPEIVETHAPSALRNQMLDALTRIQRGDRPFGGPAGFDFASLDPSATVVLHELRRSPLVKDSNPIDAQTLDIVALLFDAIFSDHEVPDALRAEIGRLQIPVLKVALMDKGFFSNRGHPVRQLLDNIAGSGVGWDKKRRPQLLAEIKAIVDAVVTSFEQDADIFIKQLERFTKFLADEEARGHDNAKQLVDQLERSDQARVARSVVQGHIHKRIHSERVPPLVSDFLDKLWQIRLIQIYEQEGPTSPA